MKRLPAHLAELNPEFADAEFHATGTANKFHARRTFRHGIWFDSGDEADRYDVLLLQRAGALRDLQAQAEI